MNIPLKENKIQYMERSEVELTEGLPNNWCWARIQDVANALGGYAFKSDTYSEKGVQLLRIGNVDMGNIDLKERPVFLCNVPEGIVSKFSLYKDDIVITMTGTRGKEDYGHVARIDCDNPLLLNQRVCRIRPYGSISAQFLSFVMMDYRFRNQLFKNETGIVGQGNIRMDDINGAYVPLPPLAEQHRIVAKLDRLSIYNNSIQQEIVEGKTSIELFKISLLRAAFSGNLTSMWREQHSVSELEKPSNNSINPVNCKVRRGIPDGIAFDPSYWSHYPSTWSMISIGDALRNGLLLDVKDGNHGSNHPKRDEFSDEGLPFITAAQVRDYAVDYENSNKLNGEALKRIKVGFSEPGDVILTHKGTVGRSGIATMKSVLTPQTTYYRCNTTRLDPYYLMYLFSSPQFFNQLSGVMSQTTRDFVPISKQYRLFIALPSINEQRLIADRLKIAMSHLHDFITALERAKIRSDTMMLSTCQNAFEGKLVPQDPNDEPASSLLERIKAERTDKPTKRATQQSRQL